jgi:uncharacterized membrane protein
MPVPPRLLALAIATLLAGFLTLDGCWLALVGPHLYRPALDAYLAPEVDWLAAGLFDFLYFTGLTFFVVTPSLAQGRPGRALWTGALFGLVAYGTYDLTNQATFAGWPWHVTAADLAWGAFASGVSSWAAVRAWSGRRYRFG